MMTPSEKQLTERMAEYERERHKCPNCARLERKLQAFEFALDKVAEMVEGDRKKVENKS